MNLSLTSAIGLLGRLVHVEIYRKGLADLLCGAPQGNGSAWNARFNDFQSVFAGECGDFVQVLLGSSEMRREILARKVSLFTTRGSSQIAQIRQSRSMA